MLIAERTDATEKPGREGAGRSQAVLDQFRDPRPPRRRAWRIALSVVLAVLVIASGLAIPYSLGLFPAPFQPPLPSDAVFAVRDKVVTKADYNARLKTVGALYGAQEPADPAGKDQFRRDSAKALMISTVLQEAEAERGLVTPETKARDTLNQLVTSEFGPGPEGYQKFVSGLGQVGTSEAAVLNEIKQQSADSELVQQVTDQVAVSDTDLPGEFPKYRDRLGTPEKRQLSMIVVPTAEQATDALNRVRGGQLFADVARGVSADSTTKDKGGDLGQVTRDQLEPAFGNAAFSAPTGQLFGPVQMQQGWYVGQVVSVTPGVPANFDQVKGQLLQVVTAQRKVDVWSAWLKNEIESANVRFADDYRPADPTGVPAALNRPVS